MGDSLTEGDGNPSAYRYHLFEKLFKAGADFRFVGPSSSRDDVRLPALYNRHGGNCGYQIGDDSDEGGGSLRKNLRRKEYSDALIGADIVLLWIGANDGDRNRESICKRYTDLLYAIWSFAPNASIYGAEMIEQYGNSGVLNDWIRNTAPTEFADKGHRFVPVKLDGGCNRLLYELGDFHDEDGHPSDEGNRKIADSWFDAVIDEVRKLNENGSPDDTPALVGTRGITLGECRDKIALGESLTLTADVYPSDASVKTVLWKSSDTRIAQIDRYGNIVPYAQGEVTLIGETLDGGHRAEKKITVEGHFDMTLGYKKIYSSDFTSKEGFSGATDRIETKYNKFQCRYLGETQEISANNFSLDSDRALLKFTYRTANHASRDIDNYSAVKFGEIELRICALASVIRLFVGGELAGEYRGITRAAIDDEFALKCEPTKASVYRNGELLFECANAATMRGAGLKLYWQELYAKSEIKNVEIYI